MIWATGLHLLCDFFKMFSVYQCKGGGVVASSFLQSRILRFREVKESHPTPPKNKTKTVSSQLENSAHVHNHCTMCVQDDSPVTAMLMEIHETDTISLQYRFVPSLYLLIRHLSCNCLIPFMLRVEYMMVIGSKSQTA